MSEDDFVRLENVAVTYGRKAESSVTALDETNLRIGKGDFIALVGPSGCGKSTILKLVGGLIPATRGYLYVAGRELGAEPVRIGIAFQNPTMLPWLKIRDNVMLPLKIVPPFRGEYRAKKNSEFRDRAEALLEQVGLRGFGDKYPWQLSGGMLQRSSLCRALVHDPQLLLLDEPFGRARSVHPRGAVGDHAGALGLAEADGDPRHARSARGRLSRQSDRRDARASRPHHRR